MILYAAAILFDIAFFALLGTRLAREIRTGKLQGKGKKNPGTEGK